MKIAISRAPLLALVCCLGAHLAAPVVVFAQSGLPGRPSNPSCVAPARPVTGTGAVIAFQQQLNIGVDPTALHRSVDDPFVWYVGFKEGRIRRAFWDGTGTPSVTVMLDIASKVVVGPEAGFGGMAFHPDFDTNGHVYVHYSGANLPGADPGPFTEYVSRFTSFDGGLTLDPASEVVLMTLPQHGIFHHGGKMVFGPDGYLYLGFGDGEAPEESQDVFQWYGKILRVDVDGGVPYAIPFDNPFAAGGGAPEVWAWGLRNPYQISFDRLTGELWAGDVGAQRWEEIDRIEAGKNYGWPVMEGNHCLVEPCNPAPYEPPVAEHLHATLGGDGLAIMGGYVYRGTAIPALAGRYVYGDWNGNVWALEDDGSGNLVPELLTDTLGPLTGIAEDAAGELYFLSTPIRKLVPGSPPGGTFPQTISASGCRDAGDPTLPSAAVVPYGVNVELWSDGAAKGRWMGLPNGTTIDLLADGDWGFPVGTVLMKDFAVGGQLIETRLLVRHDDGGWAGYTYEWNNQLTDATLLPGAKTKVVGGQTWEYPSRAQCLACHTTVAGRSLGPTTSQLNGDFFYPSTGITANQLTTLETIGMLSAPLPGPPNTLPVLPGPAQPSFPLADRARGYLQANCAHCHAPGGPTQATIDLRYGVSTTAMNLCGRVPDFGTLGVPGALLLTPGSPAASVVSLRMHATGSGRMPPLATSIVDPAGTQVVDGWITAHGSCPDPANQPPIVSITQPGDGAVFVEGASATFLAIASDVEDGDLTTAITWTSDVDGVFGSGGSVVTAGLSVGTHLVTAAVVDSGQLADQHAIEITINAGGDPIEATFPSLAAEDGNIVESSETSDVGGIVNATGSEIHVGDHFNDSQFKGFVSFDTSAIPDDAAVVAATLRLRRIAVRGTNPFTILGACRIDVHTEGFGGDAALTVGDFQAPATATAAGTLGNAPTNGDWSSGVLNAAGLAAISKTGKTQMRIAFTLDDDDDLSLDRILYGSGDHSTQAFRPELMVTYVPSAGGTTTSTSIPPTSTSTSTTTSTSVPGSTSTTTSTSTSSSTLASSTTSTTVTGTPVEVSFRSVGTADGDVVESGETTDVGGLANAAGDDIHVGDHFNDRQFRGIVSFDTSALPDGAQIVSATLLVRRVGVFGTNPFTTLGACVIDVRNGPFGGDPALHPGDFQAAPSAVASGTLSNAATNGAWSSGTLDAAGLAAVGRTGITQMRLAFALDDNDNGVSDRIRYASGDHADPASRPELRVVYIDGTATTTTTLPTTTSSSSSTTTSTSLFSTSTTSSTSTTLAGTPVVLSLRSIGAHDGNVLESSETSEVGGIVNSTTVDIHVGDHFTDGQFKGFVSFDTSAIPDGAPIVSAVLRLRRVGVFGTNPFTVLGECRIDVRTGGFGGDVALASADFQAPATVTAAGTLSIAAANGDWSSGALDAAGLAAIERTGTTQLRIAFTLDDNDNGSVDRILFASGDHATADWRPELTVTYLQ